MTQRSTYAASVITLVVCLVMITASWAQAQEVEETESRPSTPVIDPETFNSQLRLDLVEIEVAPFQRVDDVLTSYVGVNKRSPSADEIRFRGTGIQGTDVIVDGISQKNPSSNIPNSSVNLDAIENIEIQTSGFTAEYGNVRSGVVEITTKGDTGPPTLINIDDAELSQVAAAFVAIVQLRGALDRETISEEQFQRQTFDAISSQGLSLERYSQVTQAAQNNSRLQARLLELARRIAAQTN